MRRITSPFRAPSALPIHVQFTSPILILLFLFEIQSPTMTLAFTTTTTPAASFRSIQNRQNNNYYYQKQQNQQHGSTPSSLCRPSSLPSLHFVGKNHHYNPFLLTTKPQNNVEDGERKLNVFQKAKNKFVSRPGTYLIIPCIAALVGWFTNWLAVQMIFYPIQYWGIPLYRRPEVPLGVIGWQGIVPCKTKTMSLAMCDMVTTQLLTVKEAFSRLNPHRVANLLAPQVPALGMEVINDITAATKLPNFFTKVIPSIPSMVYGGLDSVQQSILQHNTKQFLIDLVKDMQRNIDSIFSLDSCVVSQMVQDRAKLGELFRKCGQKELDFLTNSGLWFGFLLGIIQMIVALFWDNPWSLSIGGLIVGLATNWLALKWIFEPVNPTKFGPFVLQGQFLRRQVEVSREFSKFFATKILSSPRLWTSMLTDPTTAPAFHTLFGKHFAKYCNKISQGLFRYSPEPETMDLLTRSAIEKLPNHLHVIHDYVDKTLGLEHTLRVKMEKMTSERFERVLHPIFEEDELTLILAGAVLGFIAGLIQQGLETGTLKIPSLSKFVPKPISSGFNRVRSLSQSLLQQIRRKFTKNSSSKTEEGPDGDIGQSSSETK